MHGRSPILLIGGAGYIGSRLAAELHAGGHDVTTVDTVDAPGPHMRMRYQSLFPEDLQPFDSVLWFAGHASAPEAAADPAAALRTLADLWELRARLRPDQRFVYASTASIYAMVRPELCSESFQPRSLCTVYDQTRAWFDALMTTGNNGGLFWGLRLGTVAGASPRLRADTTFNAMTLSAHRRGVVALRNEDLHQPVLGLPDLSRAVSAVLSGQVAPGLYNLASFHMTLGTLANAVALRFGARVEVEPPTPERGMRMSCAKFEGAARFRFRDTVASLTEEVVASAAAENGRVPA